MLVLIEPISRGFVADRSNVECTRECSHLDGVAERRAGAVCLHVTDLGRLDTRSAKGSPDGRFLGFLARHGDAVGVAVLRHRRAEDLRVDLVAVVERPAQWFDDDNRAAFSTRVAVRGVVECLGTSFGTEESALRLRDGGVGTDHDVHAAGEGEIALAVPDALRRKVYRDERSGARRVDRHAGSAEVESVRDPVRQHRHHHPGGGMRLEPVATGAALILQQLIVEGEAADEYSDVGARQAVSGNSAVFQRLPRGVQQEALLGIERVRLPRGHPEELRIELIDLTEESASAGDDLADLRRVRIVVSRGVPT